MVPKKQLKQNRKKKKRNKHKEGTGCRGGVGVALPTATSNDVLCLAVRRPEQRRSVGAEMVQGP